MAMGIRDRLRASEMGSPTNHPGFGLDKTRHGDKTRAQGSFGPFTGGRNLTHPGEPPNRLAHVKYLSITILIIATYKKLKKERTVHLTRFY